MSDMKPSGTDNKGVKYEIRQEVLEATLDQVVRTLGPERALIALAQGPTSPLQLEVQRGFVGLACLEEADVSLSTIETVFGSGRSEQSLVRGETTPPEATDSMKYAGLRSVLCAPIFRDGHEPFGVIYLDDKTKVGAFGEQHLAWLTRIGKALGSNARRTEREPDHSELWRDFREQAFRAGNVDLRLAESCLKKALACCLDGDLGALCRARTLSDLSEILRLQGRHSQALQLIKKAIVAVGAESEIGYAATIPFYNNLAGLHYELGQTEQAEALYRRIVQRADQLGAECKALIPVLCNWGTVSLKAQKLTLALSLFERASRLAAERFGEQNQIVLQCRQRLDECRRLSA